MNLVEGEIQGAGLLDGAIEEDDRHRLQAEAARGHESLMPANHAAVGAAGEDGIDKTERLNRACERIQIGVVDTARVGRVRHQLVQRHVLHRQRA